MKPIATIAAAAVTVLSVAAPLTAQTKSAAPAAALQATAGITPPPDYVIGIGDVLIINYWKDSEMTTDAVVRPDGKITLNLLNDIEAAGLRTDQLHDRLLEKSTMFEDPRITVGVRQINSRKVYISGGVQKTGQFDLIAPLTVLQLISLAGGTREFVKGKAITIIRDEGGKPRAIKFNLKEVQEGKRLEQNIQLRPGDVVLVPE